MSEPYKCCTCGAALEDTTYGKMCGRPYVIGYCPQCNDQALARWPEQVGPPIPPPVDPEIARLIAEVSELRRDKEQAVRVIERLSNAIIRDDQAEHIAAFEAAEEYLKTTPPTGGGQVGSSGGPEHQSRS